MQFSAIMIALFSTLAIATPKIYPNLAGRDACGSGCGAQPQDSCCVSGTDCCYPCKEGSDADCSPEVTERSIFGITE